MTDEGHNSRDLQELFEAARPLVEQWLDIAEQFAAMGDAARQKGIDWGQVKALVKAQVQDERDESGDGKRVRKIVDKADLASSYADMLGLGAKMNKKNFSSAGSEPEPDDGLAIPPSLRRTAVSDLSDPPFQVPPD